MSERNPGRGQVLAESKKRGWITAAAAVATGVATATVGFVPLGAVGLGATGYFGYRWIRHRVKNGIRF
jgi:hypothetical protein